MTKQKAFNTITQGISLIILGIIGLIAEIPIIISWLPQSNTYQTLEFLFILLSITFLSTILLGILLIKYPTELDLDKTKS